MHLPDLFANRRNVVDITAAADSVDVVGQPWHLFPDPTLKNQQLNLKTEIDTFLRATN